MEKIKQILSGNDTQTNASGTNTGHGLTGEGTHLGSAHSRTGSGSTNLPGTFPESDVANTERTGYGEGSHFGNTRDTSAGLGSTQQSGLGSTGTDGPHSSNLANRADPTVDSDNSRGAAGIGSGLENTQYSGLGSSTTGNDSSNLANRADPTLDSDTSRLRHTTGAGVGGTQHSGLGSSTGGPHSSNLANRADPTFDSDNSRLRDTTGAGIGATHNTGFTSGTSTSGQQGANLGSSSDFNDSVPRGPGGGITNGQNTGFTSGHGASGLHSSNLASRADPTVDSGLRHTGNSGLGSTTNTSSGNNLGRDAAALGTTGAVGEGIHHHREHERDNLGSNTHGTSTNPPGIMSSHTGNTGISGPHSTAAANLLDPALSRGSNVKTEAAHHHSAEHGGGAEEADDHHSRKGAADSGTTGLAKHEQAKYQIDRGAGVGSTGVGLSTTGQHDTPGSSGIQSGRDTTGTSGLSNQTSSRTDRHLGRDAAIAGGVGGAAYEAGQHHHSNTGSGLTGASHSGTASTGAGLTGTTQTGITSTAPHSSNLADRSATGNTSASQRTFNLADRTHDNSSKDQHYGREAAVAGGVGGAAYETGRHHNDASSGFASTGNTSSTLPHSSNLADRSVIGNTSTGQHASNVTDRTHNSSKDHHYGRDAAVAGGVGGAAYEADKHHAHDKDLTNSEREQKREHKHEIKDEKKGHKEHKGLFSFLHRDKSKKYTKEQEDEFDRQEREHISHKGRDAALGGAAVGVGAYGAEKHDQHSTVHDSELNKSLPTAPGNHGVGTGTGTQNTLAGHEGHQHAKAGDPLPLDETPEGKDLGDALHGVERNRGVAGASGFPDSESFGRDNTHHQGGILRMNEQPGHVMQGGGNTAGSGAGAGVLGEDKHTRVAGDNISSGLTGHSGQKSDLTGNSHNTSSGLTGTSGQQSGLTGNTYNTSSGLHSDEKTGLSSRNPYDNTSSGLHGDQDIGVSGNQVTSGLTGSYNSSGRNRLHKDPPASHPAAQGGIPSSGS